MWRRPSIQTAFRSFISSRSRQDERAHADARPLKALAERLHGSARVDETEGIQERQEVVVRRMRHLRQRAERQEVDRVGMTSARDRRRHPRVELDGPVARRLGYTGPTALSEVVDDVARPDDEDALRSQRPQPATELVVK